MTIIKMMRRCAFATILSIILFSCKKDVAPVTPPTPSINDLVETEPPLFTPVSTRINDVTFGLYSSVPVHYSETTKKYPLIIFIAGAGQLGTTKDELSWLLNDGMMKLIAEKKFPANFKVDGKNYSFIVLTPQFRQVPTLAEVMDFVAYAKNNYRIDLSRIYLSGLSMGGIMVTDMAAAYPAQFAAIAPISGVTYEGVTAKAEKIAKGNVPLWAFHNNDDPQLSLQIPLYFISQIKTFNPSILPKLTIFNVFGHNAWDAALNPTYKEEGMNVYEWMLHFTR
jgi:predicted peptidase